MIEGDGSEPPAERQHGGAHLGGAAVDDKKYDEQETEERSDNKRFRNSLAPLQARVAPETAQDYDRRTESSISNCRRGGVPGVAQGTYQAHV